MHQHKPERRSSFDALPRHYAVARLEDVQGDRLSGEENETQREKRNTSGTHCRVRALTTEDRKRICMCLGSATLLFLQEEYVVQPPSGHATRQRTDPVNRVIRPVIRGECWTECARRIESRPRERSTEQHRRRDRQTDGKARDLVEGAARINGCSKDNEHEKECHDAFEDHANRGRDAAGQIRRTEPHSRPNIDREEAQEIRRSYGARKLSRPKGESVDR